ncbi:MAG: SEC-C domain-containing protein [Gemmatimonadaceae bacterium]|nr:SEC-C domain-containing protein [Gemmatimonadaceae bacterium]
MDRNAPCPCGSGRKYKKCHGAAVPPEAAALPAPEREKLMRAMQLLERDRRVHTELNDWCDRKLGSEWANAALTEFAGSKDTDLTEYDEQYYVHWLLHHRPVKANERTPAMQWLEAQRARHGARMDPDVDALVVAQAESRVGLWRVQGVEPGVGYTLHDLLTNTAAFVHDDTGALGEQPDDVFLGYVCTVDDLQIATGGHLDLLPVEEAQLVANIIREQAGVTTGVVPKAYLSDHRHHIPMRNAWHEHATGYWDALEHDHEQNAADHGVLGQPDPEQT